MKKFAKWKVIFLVTSSLVCTNIWGSEVHAETATQMIQSMDSAASIKVPDIEKKAKRGKINVVVDGKDVTSQITEDQKPIITNDGITYVSVKMLETVIPETHSAYTPDNNLLTANKENQWIYVTLGKSKAYVGTSGDMKEFTFENNNVPAVAHGRTYLPLRFAIENLGCKVIWDKVTRTISISTTGAQPIIPEGIKAPKEEIQPEQYVKVACNAWLKGNVNGCAEEIGLSDAEVKALNAEIKESVEAGNKALAESLPDKLTQSQRARLAKGIQKALGKVNFSVKTVSQTETTAKVKVTTSYASLAKIVETAAKKAAKNFKGSEKDAYNQYIENVISDLENINFGKAKASATFELVYKNGQWQIEDLEKAYIKLVQMTGLL